MLQTRTTGGLSATALKNIALVCMFIDHFAVLVAPQAYTLLYFVMRFAGRTAAPIFFFFLAEGYHYTRDKNRYTLRLAIFAAISYLPFLWFTTEAGLNQRGYLNMSVIYTLLLSFLALRARHELKNVWVKAAAIVLCVLLSFIGDWSYRAVLAVLIFDYFRGNRLMQQVGFLVLIFIGYIAPLLQDRLLYVRTSTQLFEMLYWVAMWCGVLVPVLLLGKYNGERGRQNRWLFYVFYPVHLLVLAALISLVGTFFRNV